jgi:SAM-dependent methyltransferase
VSPAPVAPAGDRVTRAGGHDVFVAGIYDEPEFYAAACAYRDVAADVTALLRWWKLFGPGGPVPSTVLELAAGPAEHARAMAARGADVTALDINPVMCAFARAQAAKAGLRLAVVEGDMRDFRIAEPARFDLAITMLNSLCHLMTLDDLLAHLGSVAAHLADGGLYVAELAHPADFLSGEPSTSSEWSTDIDGGKVTVRWGGRRDHIDPVTQVTMEHVTVTYRQKDGSARTVTDVVPNRFWTGTEFEAAVRLAGGLSVVAQYGDFDGDIALDAPGAWRMIFVLRRGGPAAITDSSGESVGSGPGSPPLPG